MIISALQATTTWFDNQVTFTCSQGSTACCAGAKMNGSTVAWMTELEDAVNECRGNSAVTPDGTKVIMTGKNVLYVIDEADGTILSSKNISLGFARVTDVIFVGSTLYVYGSTPSLSEGAGSADFNLDGISVTCPAADSCGVIAKFTMSGNTLTATAAETIGSPDLLTLTNTLRHAHNISGHTNALLASMQVWDNKVNVGSSFTKALTNATTIPMSQNPTWVSRAECLPERWS